MDRRLFIRGLTAAAAISLTWLVVRLVKRQSSLPQEPKILKVGPEIREGSSFANEVIIFRKGKEIRFFSARCTHAGCHLRQLKGDNLLCPCHGSQFDAATGRVVAGPAVKPLEKLAYSIDSQTKEYIISIKNED